MPLTEISHVLHDVEEVRVDGVVGRRGRQVDSEVSGPEQK